MQDYLVIIQGQMERDYSPEKMQERLVEFREGDIPFEVPNKS